MHNKKSILLTFDVEDWFQVENFKPYIEFSTWNSFKLRVEKNTHLLLDLLDSFSFKPKATFFILGWIAEKVPDLVGEIFSRGHEVASHGYNHHLCSKLDSQDLIEDLSRSKKLLENITGEQVTGFRAPSFAVNNSILDVVQECGYLYDTSFNSFSAHGRYGTIDLGETKSVGGIYRFKNGFYEIPVSNFNFLKNTIPLGGGGYFRLYPFFLFKLGMLQVIKKNNLFVFYAHPWEFDPNQPRVDQASKGFKFRHYINLHKTEYKLKCLINEFSDCRFISCRDYIKQLEC